jgi:DNA polymerase III subunit alpha
MRMSRFVHLHTHSHYSLLEALPKTLDLVKAARREKMATLALTDSGNLYGAIEFYKECKASDIKPILGIDAYMSARTRFDKEARVDSVRTRVVLLAKDLDGYKNLLKIITASFLEGFYYKPRVDFDLLKKYKSGLIAILPAMNSTSVEEHSKKYKEIFGSDFYLEITHHPEIQGHEDKMAERVAFAQKNGYPIVASQEVYYLAPEDKAARDTVLAIQSTLGGSERGFSDLDEDFSFISNKRAQELFKDTPEALENNAKIATECNLDLPLGKWAFPNFVITSKKTADEELRDLVFAGFKTRHVEKSEENLKRLEYELGIIKTKGYAPYFLVVADLLRFAREHGILTNIRGSVAGSLTTYLAQITSVNPIEFDIPFERFLNPDRPSAPDIDMDFADDRRDEVVEYAREKYGADHVAQIGTFGTMMARGAVRDVARAMGYPYAVGDRAAKLIPIGAQGFPMTIKRAFKESPDFKKLYEEDPDTKAVVDMAQKIEGNARHISVHAAGVVISPGPMTDYTPLQLDNKGENKIITQYDMYSIDEDNVGLLKFDFLGLRNLSIIADTISRIKKIEGKDLDFDTIPMDDKKTYEMLARGETEGTFQLNGTAMTKFLTDLKPSTIHDINAMVALYRPGPMQFIPLFIERKHNPKLITYLDPALKPILEKTYGVLVYQDDLLMIAHEIAGYSWGEVDKFRKAVGKKIPEEMAAQKEKFIKGAVEHSKWTKRKAEDIWAWIEPFAAYGFNKAHSVSYGRIAYITAYLKANFPEIYMSAVLSAESGNVETVGVMVHESKRMGIEVLPPSVNESYSQFTVPQKQNKSEKCKIRFGLVTIKNFGQGIATAIIEERKKNGQFISLANFLDRVKDKNLNKKSLESLIKAGALDDFGERGQMLANLDNLLGYNREKQNESGDQGSLFGQMADTSSLPKLRLSEAPAATRKDKLTWEKDLLGLYLSGHPLEDHKEKLEKMEMKIAGLGECKEGYPCVIAGIITEIREIITKGGDKMMFVQIEDFTSSVDTVVFPRVFEEFKNFLTVDNCIAMKGKVSKRKGETSFIVEKVKNL